MGSKEQGNKKHSKLELATTSSTSSGGAIVSSAREKVVAEVLLKPGDLSQDGWVNDEVISRLSHLANTHGMTQGNSDCIVRALETRSSLFQAGQGEVLTAEAKLVHANAEFSVWSASVYRTAARQRRTAKHCIAECIQKMVLQTPVLRSDEALKSESLESVVVEGNESPASQSTVSELRRRQIFDGACDVITRDGYAATTIRKISSAANIPISTMYQYISTKEDILFMITSGCMEEIFNYFQEELVEEGTAEQKLSEAVDAYIKYISKNRKYINLAYSETRALSKENREKIFDIERQFAGLWEEIVRYGNEKNEFSIENTDLAANMIYFFCNVWAIRYWTIEKYSEQEVKDYLLRFILNGLKKPL